VQRLRHGGLMVSVHVCYHDWHRVERALAIFRLEVSELTERGWQVVH
jgi:hypothetical protein